MYFTASVLQFFSNHCVNQFVFFNNLSMSSDLLPHTLDFLESWTAAVGLRFKLQENTLMIMFLMSFDT